MTDSAIPPPPEPRKRSRRRVLKIGAILAGVMLLILLSIPTILSTAFFRERFERALSESLGAKTSIGELSLGWFSGIELRGLSIDNPAGFDPERKLLELRSLRGELSFAKLVRGKVDLAGVVEGLEVRIVQREDGRTNLDQLGGPPPIEVGGPHLDEDLASGGFLDRIRLDLALRNSLIEIASDDHGILERLENIDAQIDKEFDARRFTSRFSADLRRPGDEGPPGNIDFVVEAEPDRDRPVNLRLDCSDLDLRRYRPIVDALFPDGQVTEFAGIVRANGVKVRGIPSEELTVEGLLTIEDPHFAGPLFQGLDIHARQWTMRPRLTSTVPRPGESPNIDLAGFELDLGVLKLRGLPATDRAQALAFGFDLDLDGLAQFGGPIPLELRGSEGRLTGEVSIPLESARGDLEPGALINGIRLDAELATREIVLAGQALAALGGRATLRDGRLRFETSTGSSLGGGSIRATVDADLTDLDRPMLDIDLQVEDARVQSGAIDALRYAVPVLAGIAAEAGVDFESGMDLRLQVQGPAYPGPAEPLLKWLDRWSGSGALGLRKGRFRPAAALQQLWALSGQRARVEFEKIATDFTIAHGFVTTALVDLSTKGRRYGLVGRTSFEGVLDYTFDAKALLEDHRDGARLLRYLGDEPLGARLAGTLENPTLALPDLQDLLRKGAEKALKDGAGSLLERILGGRKKRGG